MKPDPELRDQLVTYARTVALERHWPWQEPVEVTSAVEAREAVWVIHSNVLVRGMNVRVVVRRSDHSLVQANFLPR